MFTIDCGFESKGRGLRDRMARNRSIPSFPLFPRTESFGAAKILLIELIEEFTACSKIKLIERCLSSSFSSSSIFGYFSWINQADFPLYTKNIMRNFLNLLEKGWVIMK